jgi:hypothetical protein
MELDSATEQASRLISLLQEGMTQDYLLDCEACDTDLPASPSEYTHMTRLQLLRAELLAVLEDGGANQLQGGQHDMLCTADTVVKNMGAVEQSLREFHVRIPFHHYKPHAQLRPRTSRSSCCRSSQHKYMKSFGRSQGRTRWKEASLQLLSQS